MRTKADNDMYAKVIVDIASDNVDRLFTYRVPESLGPILKPGYRVLVPFGFREQEGIVISIGRTADIPVNKVKDIISVLDDYPALTDDLLSLAQSLKEELRCTLCESLRLMIPSQMRKGRISIKKETYLRLSDSAAENFDDLLVRHKRSPKRQLILQTLSDKAEHPLKDLKVMINAVEEPLRLLTAEGSVISVQKEAFRRPYFPDLAQVHDHILTEEQKEAFDEISSAIKKRTGSVFLLHGVTGSGKTEVFVQLVREAIRNKQKAIILVPEISLTPQMIMYFYSRFGDRLAVLHSRLSAGERYDEWRRIRYGDADIVIGARSAVFAPFENIGIIIVDEEHENSYLSESHPQYDARQVAMRRSVDQRCPVVLSSATPSVYSYAQARHGNYILLEMPHRANSQPLPRIFLADMREELRNGNRSIFSTGMKRELDKCLGQNEQAILFVNRRGYAPFVNCRSCGASLKCRQCDVSLTYHKTDGSLHCHYCGSREAMPAECPVCGSRYIRQCGIGTQKVEEEFKKEFPGIGVIRMDQDTTAAKNAHANLLNAFRARKAQVLIGTQMVAKGHDFPSVTFVGAVLADLTLNLPDYRSAERTYQLLVQAAGRAGRGNKQGTVVIQTYKPDHYAIQSAVEQDYRSFFNEEFSRRKRSLYPPFTRISRILIEGTDEDAVIMKAREADKRIASYLDEHPNVKRLTVFHRADYAPIKRIQNRYRAQVLIKTIENPGISGLTEELNIITSEFDQIDDQRFSAIYEINPASLA